MLYCCCLVTKLCPTLLQHWLPESLWQCHFPQQCMKILFSSSLLALDVTVLCFMNLSVKWHHISTLIYIPQLLKNLSIFSCVLACSSVNCVFMFWGAYFSLELFILFLSVCKIFLYSIEIKLLLFVLQILKYIPKYFIIFGQYYKWKLIPFAFLGTYC